MTIAAALPNANWIKKRAKVLNALATPGTMSKGDVVQYKPAVFDNRSCIQPLTANGLLGKFAGVLEEDLGTGQNRNAGLVIEGDVFCKYKNTSDSDIGTWAIPVTGQDYFTYSARPTGIMLLTDQSSGTAEHTPNEASAPKVRIYEGVGEMFKVKTLSVQIADISDASSLDYFTVAPCALQILGVQTILGKAITTGDAVITVTNGAGGDLVASVTVANSSSAPGDVDETVATAANAVFARGDDIEVLTDGGSTVAASCLVLISYVELAVQ